MDSPLRVKSKLKEDNFDHNNKKALVIVRRTMTMKPLVSLMRITLMMKMMKTPLVCVTHSPICPHVSRS